MARNTNRRANPMNNKIAIAAIAAVLIGGIAVTVMKSDSSGSSTRSHHSAIGGHNT